METQQTNKENHVFGESDTLVADDYQVGDVVKIKPTTFLGRQEYISQDGTKEKAPFYKVLVNGLSKDWRMNMSSEKVAARKFGCKSYENLINKELELTVKKKAQFVFFLLSGMKG